GGVAGSARCARGVGRAARIALTRRRAAAVWEARQGARRGARAEAVAFLARGAFPDAHSRAALLSLRRARRTLAVPVAVSVGAAEHRRIAVTGVLRILVREDCVAAAVDAADRVDPGAALAAPGAALITAEPVDAMSRRALDVDRAGASDVLLRH